MKWIPAAAAYAHVLEQVHVPNVAAGSMMPKELDGTLATKAKKLTIKRDILAKELDGKWVLAEKLTNTPEVKQNNIVLDVGPECFWQPETERGNCYFDKIFDKG